MIYGKSLARAGQSGSLASCPAALRPRTWARVVRRYATARYDPNKSRLSQPLRLFSRLLALQWDKKLTLLARNSPSRGKNSKRSRRSRLRARRAKATLHYFMSTRRVFLAGVQVRGSAHWTVSQRQTASRSLSVRAKSRASQSELRRFTRRGRRSA